VRYGVLLALGRERQQGALGAQVVDAREQIVAVDGGHQRHGEAGVARGILDRRLEAERIHAAGVRDDLGALVGKRTHERLVDRAHELVDVATVAHAADGLALVLGLAARQDAHRDLGQVVGHQVVQRRVAQRHELVRSRGTIAPEARRAADAHLLRHG